MKSFKVSIILPVYNVEKYLENCLDSLLAQTLDDIEIVAVNDGSTDSSLQILEAYQQRHPKKLFVYSIENQGVSHARNYGFAHSHGEYIWFVDSDDYIESNACQLLYEKAVTDHNDLVLFRFNNVTSDTGEKKPSPVAHHNQNFTIAQKPYELANMVLYTWNKLIHHSLFHHIEFPEGICFSEDVPVSFQLYTRAKSIGVVNTCFYNYIRSIGSSEALSATTFDICKSYTCVIRSMKELGFYDSYYSEISYVAVRHILFRLKKLLTSYEAGQKQLKLDFVKTVYNFLDHTFPDWRNNIYVRYTLPAPVAKMFYFYETPDHFLKFIENCDSLPIQQQKKWLKEYKVTLEEAPGYQPAEMLRREKASAQFYKFAYTGSLAPDPEQIFLETKQGKGISSWILDVLIMLAQNFGEHRVVLSLSEEQQELFNTLLFRKASGTILELRAFSPEQEDEATHAFLNFVQPQSEEYGKALALSGYILTDSPLPYYFQKEDGQFCLLYCGQNFYPETFLNTPSVHVDTGLWQHTMFMADCLYFNNEQNRHIYQEECMVKGICPTPYIIGNNSVNSRKVPSASIPVNLPDDFSWDSPDLPSDMTDSEIEIIIATLIRNKIRRCLQMDGRQSILYAPLLPGSYLSDSRQTFRNFMSALYILDQEFNDQQTLYLHLDPELEMDVDFSDFVHIEKMPRDFDVEEFALSCDIFLSDYHSALEKDFIFGTRKVRFVCGSFQQRNLSTNVGNSPKRDDYFPDYPFFDNAPELAHYLKKLQTAVKSESAPCPEDTLPDSTPEPFTLSDTMQYLLNGRPLPYQDTEHSHALNQNSDQESVPTAAERPEQPHRPRVLFFTGRKLSQNLVRDFNALAAQAPEKDFWLAYNDFRNPDSHKYLAQLAPECFYLPLKPEPEKSRKWKLASILTSRMGLSAFYPISHLLALGKEEYGKMLGNAAFDEVIITSTDCVKTVATLLAAAPVASYTFDTFSPERYSTSRPYRNQIAFLCRLLKNAGCLELPEELTGMKLAHSSGGKKNKKAL